MTATKNTLLIANFDSGVGYAWTLIEDFWIAIHHENLKMNRGSIICYPSISKIPEKIEAEKILTCLNNFNHRSPIQILKNINFIIRNNIDTLYLTDQETQSYKYVIYRLFGIKKIIVHDHSPGIRTIRNAFVSSIKKHLLNKVTSLRCDAAFAVSPYITERLRCIDALPVDLIFDVTNGIAIRNTPKKDHSSSTINIVSVARLTQYKGVDFALKAFAKATQETKEKALHYYIIGDGPELNQLKSLAKTLGVADLVTFTGKLDHRDVIAHLETCHIAFHPSKGEAMSLAILEYMQSELAVLTSDNPSVCSAFQANQEGITYQESNLADSAEKLKLLIENNTLRVNLGKAARAKVISHYSDSLMMQKLIAAYRKVIIS